MPRLLEFMYLIIEIMKLFKDSDGDGRPDLFDSEPHNPEVK